MTFLLNVNPLLISKVVVNPADPFSLKNNLNPLLIPFLEANGGNCQEAVIAEEVTAVTVKLLGGCDGAAIEKHIIIK